MEENSQHSSLYTPNAALVQEYADLLKYVETKDYKFPKSYDEMNAVIANRLRTEQQNTSLLRINEILKNNLTQETIDITNRGFSRGVYSEYVDTIIKGGLESDIVSNIYFTEHPLDTYNANLIKVNHGYICLFNTGFRRFIFHTTSCFGYPYSENKNENFSPSFPSESNKFWLTTFINSVGCCINYCLSATHTDYHQFTNEYTDWAAAISSQMGYSIKTFAVAHEIAHVALGHYQSDNISSESDIAKSAHDKELEADRFANQRLLESARRLKAPWLLGGGPIFCMTMSLVEKVSDKIYGASVFDKTHPTFDDRLAETVQFLVSECSRNEMDFLGKMYFVPLAINYILDYTRIEKSDKGYSILFDGVRNGFLEVQDIFHQVWS